MKGQLDILRVPLLGRFLRWRWGRLSLQVTLLLISGLVIYDGFTGQQLAPANSATVLVWVHFRGLLILALLIFGNLFCMACPFTIPRTIARKLSLSGQRWPRILRNKWISIFALLLIFWLYEWLDLWASPWLTAWLTIAFFVTSFVLEALFAESPFCKYVCPLGAFNYVHSKVSPFQIQAREASICRTCEDKECVNGSETVLGCGTELFVPMINSNMDCTFCLDCARACPYDNVSLNIRDPLIELHSAESTPRWDLSFLLVSLTIFAMLNAFGMVPPIYKLQSWLVSTLGIASEWLGLILIFILGAIGITSFILFGSSRLSSLFSQLKPRSIANDLAPAFVPMGFGIWFAHYSFHFSIGALTLFPVMKNFLLDHGIKFLGETVDWNTRFILPDDWIFPIQIAAVLIGFFAALYILGRKGLTISKSPKEGFLILLPWAIVLLTFTLLSLSIFNMPMQMRGTFLSGVR
jgi:ferredoxin